MTYILNVFISMLPFLKIAAMFAVIWGVANFIYKREFIERMNEVQRAFVVGANRGIKYAFICYIGFALGWNLLNPTNTPKNTVKDNRAAAVQMYQNRANAEPTGEVVDRTRQNKMTDEQREQAFKEMVKIKKED